MDRQSPPVNELTIKQELLQYLEAALSSYILDTQYLTDCKSYIPLQLSKQQLSQQQRIVYSCAIAFKLSTFAKLPAVAIANSISHLICQHSHQQNLILQVVDPGWIYIELTPPSLAAWLQHWIETLPSLRSQELGIGKQKAEGAEGEKPLASRRLPLPTHHAPLKYQLPITHSLFPIQYAHARCCSLLHMAHREKIITITSRNSDISRNGDINSPCLEVISPQPLPWLSEAKIYLNRPSELNLLIELIGVLDDLYCPDPTRQSLNWLKVALNLSQAFQTFYSQCRIWGEVKSQNRNLAQARLGLVAIAQSVFRILLVEILDSFAPPEL